MRMMCLALATMFGPGAALAGVLDIAGPYGNEAGCKFATQNEYTDDTLLMISPDEYSTYVTGCEFLQALPAKDGSKVMTMLCSHEGEELRTVEFMRIQASTDVGDSYDLYTAAGDHLGIVGRCR